MLLVRPLTLSASPASLLGHRRRAACNTSRAFSAEANATAQSPDARVGNRCSGTAKSAMEMGGSPGFGATGTCFWGWKPCASNSRRKANSSGEPTPAAKASHHRRRLLDPKVFVVLGFQGSDSKEGMVRSVATITATLPIMPPARNWPPSPVVGGQRRFG